MAATEVWKQFEENSVTHSMGHYLMAIRDLFRARGYARVTDVAAHLGVSRSSASTSLSSLKKKGHVVEDDNQHLRLTPSGEAIAVQIVKNHLVLERFFINILGVEEEQALIDACKMEHLLSPETSIRLLALIQTLLNDPVLKERAIQGVGGDLRTVPEKMLVGEDAGPPPIDVTLKDLKANPI